MRLQMKKVGICILHPWYISSWFDTSIIKEIAVDNEVEILAPAEIIDLCKEKALNIDSIKFIEIKVPSAKFVSRAYFFVAMVFKRKINSSFKIRLKYLLFGEVRVLSSKFEFKNLLAGLSSNLKHFLKYCRNYFYQLPAYIPFIDLILFNSLKFLYHKSSASLPEQFKRKYDLIIFVGGNIEIEIFEMLKELNKIGTTSALCIENWDNLTSKRFIITVPNYIFVMGKDSAELASIIQGIDKKRIVVAGLPRFNPYRTKNELAGIKSQSGFTILYLGCYQPHNEVKLINDLTDRLNNSNMVGKYRLIYKPHPGARNRYKDDPTLRGPVDIVSSSSRANPTIDNEHKSVINKANIIISTPTSMLIECMLLGKKTILDLTNDGVHRSTAGLAFNNYIHFEILNKISNLEKCFEVEQLIKNILFEFNHPTISYIKYNLTDLIENNRPSYSSHILEIIKKS
jgi:hypothetical protein